MRGFRDMRGWLRLPGRIGLLLGLGALSVAGARADTTAPTAITRSATPGGLSVRSEEGRIYVSENGGDFQEIQLGDTQEARHVAQLLAGREAGSDGAGMALHPIILAGSGGDGFHWTSPPRGQEAVKPADRSPNGHSRPAPGSSPTPHPSGNATGEPTGDKG